jgi:hypothetical protein
MCIFFKDIFDINIVKNLTCPKTSEIVKMRNDDEEYKRLKKKELQRANKSKNDGWACLGLHLKDLKVRLTLKKSVWKKKKQKTKNKKQKKTKTKTKKKNKIKSAFKGPKNLKMTKTHF